mmetsp:Transcript_7275/g.9430  ORF Transcript_7275/g.9430 Transcript_7275/m.9430 type:complete len:87 (+) Transcript_7275:455-715(+)
MQSIIFSVNFVFSLRTTTGGIAIVSRRPNAEIHELQHAQQVLIWLNPPPYVEMHLTQGVLISVRNLVVQLPIAHQILAGLLCDSTH